jgi:hypothetical protein
MANFNKSFNFRNGVQVDNDHFIVNANGLVGIGSTVPTQALDISGNINVSGFVTAPNLYTKLLSSPAASITTVTAGVVTANYFYGDGQNIINIPTSQWVNIDVGLGFTSIYARGYVGIVTTDPRFALQVGNNPQLGQSGVGIDSTGNIKATGIITANSFSGSGQNITAINANNITSGTLSNTALPPYISVSGIITATGGFRGNITGIASTALTLSGTPSISVSDITANSYYSTGILTSSTINATSIVTTSINLTSLNVGTSGTIFNVTNFGGVGIGTSLPTSDLQLRKSNATLLEVLSDTTQSSISIGQSVGVGKSTAVLRFGNTPKTFDIINNDTGSINQYLHAGIPGVGTGRFSWLYGQTNNELMSLTYQGSLGIGITNPSNTLHVAGTSTVTGDANFGGNVTISGSLTPGTLNLSQFTGNVIGNLTGNVNATSGVSTFNNIQTNSNIILSSSSSIGIGTTLPIVYLDARNKSALFGSVGVGTTALNSNTLSVNGSIVAGKIGIGTTSTNAYLGVYGNIEIYPPFGGSISNIKLYSSEITFDNITRIGIGTTAPRSVLDFADAGRNFASGQGSFILPPRLNAAQRVGLATVEGAFIYNTSTKKFQGYTGSAWADLN